MMGPQKAFERSGSRQLGIGGRDPGAGLAPGLAGGKARGQERREEEGPPAGSPKWLKSR